MGSLHFLGNGVLSQASFPASYLQQKAGPGLVSDFIEESKILRKVRLLSPVVKELRPQIPHSPCYLAFSDASQELRSCGQTGYFSGLFFPARGATYMTSPIGSVVSKKEYRFFQSEQKSWQQFLLVIEKHSR